MGPWQYGVCTPLHSSISSGLSALSSCRHLTLSMAVALQQKTIDFPLVVQSDLLQWLLIEELRKTLSQVKRFFTPHCLCGVCLFSVALPHLSPPALPSQVILPGAHPNSGSLLSQSLIASHRAIQGYMFHSFCTTDKGTGLMKPNATSSRLSFKVQSSNNS